MISPSNKTTHYSPSHHSYFLILFFTPLHNLLHVQARPQTLPLKRPPHSQINLTPPIHLVMSPMSHNLQLEHALTPRIRHLFVRKSAAFDPLAAMDTAAFFLGGHCFIGQHDGLKWLEEGF